MSLEMAFSFFYWNDMKNTPILISLLGKNYFPIGFLVFSNRAAIFL
jgi:hypothetical protein